MEIRNYSDKDYEKLEKLLKDAGIYSPVFDSRKNFKKKVDYEPDSIILVEENGKIIGTVFIVYDPWNPWILHLAVDKEYRKKGIGSLLFEVAEKRIKARGNSGVTGFVPEQKKEVVEFCKKRGYAIAYKSSYMVKKLK